MRFPDHWTRLSRKGRSGRDKIAKEIHELIRKMSKANPAWGSLKIMGELKKLGIEIAKSTITITGGHIYLWIWIILDSDQFRQKVRSWNSL